jgi:two-component system phosphate regulon sensor histidine kinase PhoR
MVKTIFRNTILVGVTVLVLCAALFFGLQYTQVRDDTYEALQQAAAYAETGLQMEGISYLKTLDIEDRVTLIGSDGSVLYDNQFGEGLPSQLDDKEVQEALSEGSGKSIRKDNSSGENTIYYAVLREDGSVLRIGCSLDAMRQALNSLSMMLWVLILLLLISIVLSFRMANTIVRPINNMNLDDPSANPYPELTPLVERIQEQSLTIREDAEQREQLRREFTANVSHELKTPLTSISGFAELMTQGLVPPEKIPEFAGDIYRESQRLINLIDDIIRLSKLDENAIAPDWELVDLYDLSADILSGLRPVAEKQNVELHITGSHVSISGIRRLLDEMVFNLCDNAVKYNRPGGTVTVDIQPTDEGATLKVIDTGIGIPKDKQDRVFERFYRVDKSHSRELGGTGLGLSIVKHGAQFLGADVHLESSIETGTTITLDLKKNPETPQEKEAEE